MIFSVSEIKKPKHIDNQRQEVYSFDCVIEDAIKDKGTVFPKLHRNLDETATLQQLSDHISEDFGLNVGELGVSDTKFSFYHHGKIWLHPIARNSNDLETLLHEYAHLFVSYFFNMHSAQAHGGEFMSVFRFLLDHYDILSKEEFDKISEQFGKNVDIYKDYVDCLKFMTEDELKHLYDETKKEENNKKHPCFWTSFSFIEREYISTEKQAHFFIKNKKENVFIYTCVNKCAYEYETPFFNLTKEELKKTVLLSSAYLMGYDGEKCTSPYEPRYYGYSEVDGSFLYNPLGCFYSQQVKLGDDCTKEEKKIISKEITIYAKNLKKEGYNVIKAKSEKEYQYLYRLMKERYFTLRNEENKSAA